MLVKIIFSAVSIFMLSGCGGGGGEPMSDTADTKPYMSIRFEENSSVNLSNPDRGFYDADYELNKEVDYNRFADPHKKGYSLVYAPINLQDYVTTTTLPNTLLKTIDKNLQEATTVGVKLILKIKYSSGIGYDDARLSIIKGHLDQLKPILQKHKKIISVIQAGVIGAWGEWHSFTGDFADTNSSYKENRRAIISKLSEIFPDKYIQIRTPTHKELLYGSSEKNGDKGTKAMITEDIAFSDDIRAKLGHHNDCFLASSTDMGTYPSDDITFWQNYVINDTKYAPVGGETCKDDSRYTNCTNALKELKRFQYSYLNESYKGSVIQRWKDEGCYDEINENLGYRLIADELNITKGASSITFKLDITNKGFSSPYVNYDVNFVLKNDTDRYSYPQSLDTRRLYAGETKSLTQSVNTTTLKSGKYCLYLQIGSGYSSVKLSDSKLWDETTKMNKLTCGVEVD